MSMLKTFARSISKSAKEAVRTGVPLKQKLRNQETKHLQSLPEWTKRDRAIKVKHGGWNPVKKLDRQQIQELRNITKMLPHLKTVQLGEMFRISPESVRRILKSNWVPTDEDEDKLLERFERRRRERREQAASRPEAQTGRGQDRTINRQDRTTDRRSDGQPGRQPERNFRSKGNIEPIRDTLSTGRNTRETSGTKPSKYREQQTPNTSKNQKQTQVKVLEYRSKTKSYTRR